MLSPLKQGANVLKITIQLVENARYVQDLHYFCLVWCVWRSVLIRNLWSNINALVSVTCEEAKISKIDPLDLSPCVP